MHRNLTKMNPRWILGFSVVLVVAVIGFRNTYPVRPTSSQNTVADNDVDSGKVAPATESAALPADTENRVEVSTDTKKDESNSASTNGETTDQNVQRHIFVKHEGGISVVAISSDGKLPATGNPPCFKTPPRQSRRKIDV